mgnify:CR=1 FL=1
MTTRIIVFFVIFYASFYHRLKAAEHIIGSADELSSLSLKPGDQVVLSNGNWQDQKLIFRAQGTEKAPVHLRARDAGKVILKGNSSLLIDGSWLIVEGLKFEEGYTPASQHAVVFSERSTDCRLTNTAIIDYNHPETNKIFNFWILVYGIRNRIDHCFIKGKTTRGTAIGVNISDKPNHHRIDHNYFGHRPDVKANGGEIIRIGTDVWSMHDSYTTVEDNVFEHCDGEIEIISNKSGHNTIRNNLFYESKGTLTLRHGNNAEVYGNFFIGNGVEETGGIRIIGENHQIYDNYFLGLRGTGLKAVFALTNAWQDPPLHGYWQVKNVRITQNTIVDCKEVFVIGAGKDAKTFVPPVSTVITNNLLVGNSTLINSIEKNAGIRFLANTADHTTPTVLPAGIESKKVEMSRSGEGLLIPTNVPLQKSQKIAALLNAADIGINWMDVKIKFEIKTVYKSESK